MLKFLGLIFEKRDTTTVVVFVLCGNSGGLLFGEKFLCMFASYEFGYYVSDASDLNTRNFCYSINYLATFTRIGSSNSINTSGFIPIMNPLLPPLMYMY